MSEVCQMGQMGALTQPTSFYVLIISRVGAAEVDGCSDPTHDLLTSLSFQELGQLGLMGALTQPTTFLRPDSISGVGAAGADGCSDPTHDLIRRALPAKLTAVASMLQYDRSVKDQNKDH